ncbi:pyridoxal phosphate-dependent transferase [Xylariaceae sp. FL1272]|nr:pyridoxal phosphate-dependent transferase [Xylariaceae sp. FL1272]
MVKIPVFEVEQWMDTYETTPGVLNIAETCCSSISLTELEGFHNSPGSAKPLLDPSTRMTYGAIRGSYELRYNIAATYAANGTTVNTENILVTQGAIAANHLVFYSLVGPGDHVVCVFPTYQQLYEIPKSLGAEVSLLTLEEKHGYVPSIEKLEGLIKENTKMIVVNNPNNPTGATTPISILQELISLAKKHDIIILADEVYSPLYHSLPEDQIPPSALSLGYEKVIATSSMSKAWALAGIRLGWVASQSSEIISILAKTRDYTTISVSQLDDAVARFALSNEVRPNLLARNKELAKTNLALLEKFVQEHKGVVEWVKPTAGTTAFVKFLKDGKPVNDVEFCKDVLEKTKVMFVPGELCFGHGMAFDGFVRIGYVSETDVLKEALERLGGYIRENLG